MLAYNLFCKNSWYKTGIKKAAASLFLVIIGVLVKTCQRAIHWFSFWWKAPDRFFPEIHKNTQCFLNANKSDFHADFLADIKKMDISCGVKFYKDLFSFISTTFNRDEHVVTYNELDKIADILEDLTLKVVKYVLTNRY